MASQLGALSLSNSVDRDAQLGMHAAGTKKLKLYSYWLSSCSHRVRIGLGLKGIYYEYIAVDLHNEEHHSPEYLKVNPVGFAPALVDGEVMISDSFAILLYLEEKFPQNPLLPKDPHKRAINYQAASIVCSGIHPFQNFVIVKVKQEKLAPDHELVNFARVYILKGFSALEKLLKDYAGKYATGDEVFLADIFLVPQIDSAVQRFSIDMKEFPLLQRIYEACSELPAFQDALPNRQPDTPPEYKD